MEEMTVLGISWLAILSTYLAVGVILCSGAYIRNRLTEAKGDLENGVGSWLVLPAPMVQPLLLRLVEHISAPLVVVALWPVMVWWMVGEKWFTERSPEPAEFVVTGEHLRDVLSLEAIEAGARVIDPLGAVPDLPFGHLNPAWERLKAGMQPGDQISTFVAPWQEHGAFRELSGFVIVRDGEAVSFWITGQRTVTCDGLRPTDKIDSELLRDKVSEDRNESLECEEPLYIPSKPTGNRACSHCGGLRTTRYVYGLVGYRDEDAVREGQIIYAGCSIFEDHSCEYKCHDCGKDFHIIKSSTDEGQSKFVLPPRLT